MTNNGCVWWVLEDDHNEDETEQDTHSSTSWVNEILNAHTMLQFIHMRAVISSNVVLCAIKKEYKDHNKIFDAFCNGYCWLQR